MRLSKTKTGKRRSPMSGIKLLKRSRLLKLPLEPKLQKRDPFIHTVSNILLTSLETNRSARSNASKASFRSQVAAEKAKRAQEKPEWDRSTVASDKKQTVEDKVASRIAGDILANNQKIKGVHSNQSIKKLLEREAKRQLLAETGGVYHEPTVSKLVERGNLDKDDPSNLPHLHKCPYV